jgi:UDP-N-acetylmuramoyl-L-alanyl-D-glutamate--2,6-diaminopimelate ligase
MAAEHIGGVPLALLVGDELAGSAGEWPVRALTQDSRCVVAGAVFVALPGTSVHGVDFLDEALGRGAAVVLHDADDPAWRDDHTGRCGAAHAVRVAVPDLAHELGAIAARYYGEPSRSFESVVAVTGTDGKTSVTHFVADMLDDGDAPAAVLGTLGRGRPGKLTDAGLTTPDTIALQGAFAELAGAGIHRVALEASSHGLAQYRLDGTRIDVAVLTQLGRDHLDYHADEEAYAAAKARLFHWPDLQAAVLNTADTFGRRLDDELPAALRRVTYGGDDADLGLRGLHCEATGMSFELTLADAALPVRVPLLGAFNADNLLAAAAALYALGYSGQAIAARMARVQPVPGRMELFRAPDRAGVVVDYAHNAGALTAALEALRPHTAGRLWCIFGAGGDRDRGKRPLMGAAAAAGADRVIVTDDNPRGEDPARIAAEILAGMPDDEPVAVEHDRGRALEYALAHAGADDLILLAGKGHETSQTRGARALPWSDRDAARDYVGPSGGGS